MEFEQGVASQFVLGAHHRGSLAMPGPRAQLLEPAPDSACLQTLRFTSRRLLDTFSAGEAFSPDQVRLPIEQALGSCEAASEAERAEIAWIRASWDRFTARQLTSQLAIARALELFDKTCQTVQEGACRDALAIRELQADLRLSRVSRTDATLDEVEPPLPFMGKAGLSFLALSGMVWPGGEDALTPGQAQSLMMQTPAQTITPGERTPVQASAIAIDGETSSAAAAAIVANMADRDSLLWTAFIVESDAAGPYPVLLFASPKHIADSQGPRIDLIPSAQGIAIRVDEEGEGALSALDELDALAAYFTTNSAGSSNPGALPVFVIHTDAEVPFDLIARLHERIGLWADATDVDAPLWIVLE